MSPKAVNKWACSLRITCRVFVKSVPARYPAEHSSIYGQRSTSATKRISRTCAFVNFRQGSKTVASVIGRQDASNISFRRLHSHYFLCNCWHGVRARASTRCIFWVKLAGFRLQSSPVGVSAMTNTKIKSTTRTWREIAAEAAKETVSRIVKIHERSSTTSHSSVEAMTSLGRARNRGSTMPFAKASH
jgi:hypothetical protein